MKQYLTDILEQTKDNLVVSDAFTKADSVINNPKYEHIICSISGGADSDVMMDLVYKIDRDRKVKYVWFNTGVEYQATKDHLTYLENRYNVDIIRKMAKISIPLSCQRFGQPLLSKKISEYIERLQKHGFKWEDKSFDELIHEYPKCKSALRWWCNAWGENSKFNIEYRKYLKEFMLENPPDFKVSAKCCKFAKKDLVHDAIKEYQADLNIFGVRKSEGGARSTAYKNCFTMKQDTTDEYRPLFWFKDEDRYEYEQLFDIIHSDCYTKYGLTRTGCIGCPFGHSIKQELCVAKKHEPKMYKAVSNIFKDSYAYTDKYKAFIRYNKDKEKGRIKLF